MVNIGLERLSRELVVSRQKRDPTILAQETRHQTNSMGEAVGKFKRASQLWNTANNHALNRLTSLACRPDMKTIRHTSVPLHDKLMFNHDNMVLGGFLYANTLSYNTIPYDSETVHVTAKFTLLADGYDILAGKPGCHAKSLGLPQNIKPAVCHIRLPDSWRLIDNHGQDASRQDLPLLEYVALEYIWSSLLADGSGLQDVDGVLPSNEEWITEYADHIMSVYGSGLAGWLTLDADRVRLLRRSANGVNKRVAAFIKEHCRSGNVDEVVQQLLEPSSIMPQQKNKHNTVT